MFELLIQNGDRIFKPLVQDGVEWTTERKGAPSTLKFSVVKDGIIDFTEGNSVRFKVNGENVFYGFVFSKSRDKEQIISVTAYDQLRYLKNKDTYVYTNKTASDVIRMIITDFELNAGTIEDTSFVIATRTEDNKELFDVIYNALDLELVNKGNLFILYDDFGQLCLKGADKMRVDVLIDGNTGENFEYKSSIDDATYNKIKLSRENDETGKREIYIAQDGSNIDKWGILQHFDTLQEGEIGDTKADALLSLYNSKTRNLKVLKAFGDLRIRAGVMPVIDLNLGDIIVRNHMMVERAVHTFGMDEHFMDLTLRGGEFVG